MAKLKQVNEPTKRSFETNTKKLDINPNSSVIRNNNTNNNNVHINIEHPKPQLEKIQPNWAFKAIIAGIITLIISVTGYYLKKGLGGGHGQLPTKEQNSPTISGNK